MDASLERLRARWARLCFVFADLGISTHDYAIRLGPDAASPTPVFIIYNSMQPVAASFCEFIERYLAGDHEMLVATAST